MTATFRQIVRYLHDCHRADNREMALLDLFVSKVEWKRIVPPGDVALFDPAAGPVPVDMRLAQIARRAALHHGEKSLLGGQLFLVGHLLEGEKKRRIGAPIYLAPLHWHDDAEARRLEVEREKWRLNAPLLEAVAAAASKEPADVDRWLELWPAPDAGPEAVLDAARRWVDELAGLVRDGIDLRPENAFSEAKIRRLRSTRRSSPGGAALELVWAEVVFLVRRSPDSRGVLTELERLAAETPSAPLRRLLLPADPRDEAPAGGGDSASDSGSARQSGSIAKTVLSPAILSPAQSRVVASAVDEELSLVIGPPGTGKSFTIAAIALDALARGRSVLVSSKMNHAVDVVGDKLEALLGLGEVAVRGGRREYKKELRDRLGRWLSGDLPRPDGRRGESLGASFDTGALGRVEAEVEEEVGALGARLAELEAVLEARSRDEQRWGEWLVDEEKGSWWRRRYARFRRSWLDRRLAGREAYWQQMESYRQTQEERLEALRHLLQVRFTKRLSRVLENRRRELTRLRDAVRARTVSRREDLWREIDAETLLEALPIWLVNLSDLAAVLPMRREIFDLVIIDEATQCDIASCLPALHRAKRAVIVGDPKQLRHLSFLPRARQHAIARRHGLGGGRDGDLVGGLGGDLGDDLHGDMDDLHGDMDDSPGEALDAAAERLDYRDRSILDAVDSVLSSQRAVSFLDEHFRSAPSIIGFSNREFYGSRLRVMQESPAHDWHRALYLHRVDGRRGEDGVNQVEAEALAEAVRERVRAEEDRPADLRHSIGVLSPFRAQVDSLTELLATALPPGSAEAHGLRVGTAHAFQGEERDFMYVSLCLDPSSHASAFRYLERADVFNVSITRARGIQVVFTSLDPRQLDSPDAPGSGLLRRFLEHMQQDRSSPSPGPISDTFATAVAERLRLEGCRVWAPYPVAGFDVDVVAEREGRALGIDLVGCVGEYAGSFDIERYRLFNRAGLPLMPLPYSAWLGEESRCVEAVLRRLERRRSS